MSATIAPVMARLSEVCARLAGAVLLCIVAPVATGALAADRVAMRFEVYGLMGLRVLTLHSQLEQNGGRYIVTAEYATSGVAGLVVEQATRAVARGRLTQGSAQPESFRNQTRRNGVDLHSWVDYRPDGGVNGGTAPALANPIPADSTGGTVDNLTAYLRLERQLAATRSCALNVRVFDGRHRYDLVFSGGQQQVLAPEGEQRFAGTVIACRMERHNRAGDASEQTEGVRQGTLWYAELVPGGDVLIPVRMRLRSQIGTVDGYLAELHGRGVDLRLIE
jgi:hypothetical protein